MSHDTNLHIAREGTVLCLTLNRPDKLNALTEPLISALTEELTAASADPEIRAVLIGGAGRAFCAGQDLGRRDPDGPDWPPDLWTSVSENYGPLVLSILRSSKPVVCAVNGVAAGAGANLALACDIVIASETARFIQSFTRVGLMPDAAGTWVLPRLVGLARARAICLTGAAIEARQAAEWGMIWKVVPDERLADETRALAHELAKGPTVALGLAKRALLESAAVDVTQQLTKEADFQAQLSRTSDYAEGVRAFLAKRPPDFSGR